MSMFPILDTNLLITAVPDDEEERNLRRVSYLRFEMFLTVFVIFLTVFNSF